MGRPNLFDFATSELSQDAFLCWLAALAGHDEPELQQLGRAFIAWLWGLATGKVIASDQIRLLGSPRRQVERVDILFEADVAGCRALFLIEDKTETSHHSGQLERYLSLFKNSETVVPIYFKTGYHFGTDAAAAAAGYTVIGLAEWVSFLEEQSATSEILRDYRAYVARLLEERTGALALLDTNGGFEAFKHDFAQYEFMKRLAAACPESLDGSVTYRGRSIGGAPWTQHRFAKFRRALPGSIDEALFHRIDRRQGHWYLSTRQYATVKNFPEAQAAKLRRLARYRQVFGEVAASASAHLNFSVPSADHRGKNESEIGILFFDGTTNTPRRVLELFPAVHRQFLERIQAF